MRGLRLRIAGSPDDAEGGGCHEQGRLRRQRCDEAAAGLRQGQAAAVQISARDRFYRGVAEDRNGQDRSSGRDEDVTVIASVAKQSIAPREERMDCFVASLLAMTKQTTPPAPSRHKARSDRQNTLPASCCA